MPRVRILADDLSGASDCGIACVHAGLSAMVSLGTPRDADATADVLSLDAHTSVLSADAAADRIRRLVTLYAGDKSTRLFKKIDSTMPGHLIGYIAGLLLAR